MSVAVIERRVRSLRGQIARRSTVSGHARAGPPEAEYVVEDDSSDSDAGSQHGGRPASGQGGGAMGGGGSVFSGTIPFLEQLTHRPEWLAPRTDAPTR